MHFNLVLKSYLECTKTVKTFSTHEYHIICNFPSYRFYFAALGKTVLRTPLFV